MLSSIAYQQASLEEREKYSNGCGPSWFPKKVSDALSRVFGYSVRLACAIHDWDYGHGYDRKTADKRLLLNLKILAKKAAASRRMLYSRLLVAYIYYCFVRAFGAFGSHRKAKI